MSEAFAAVVRHVEKASCARIRWDAYDGSGCSQTLNGSCYAKACYKADQCRISSPKRVLVR